MKDVKIVFIDLDGTLTNHDGKITDRAFKIIEKLKKIGIYIVFTTGRSIPYTINIAKHYNPSGYMITSNGAEIYNYVNDNLIYASSIKEENLAFLDNLVTKYNLIFTANSKDYRYTNKLNDNLGKKLVEKLTDINNEVNQIVIQSTNIDDMKYFRRDLNENTELKITNKGGITELRDYYFYDVTNSEASKGNAIVKLCELLGIDLSKTMAIGDAGNDIDMFNVCAYKVAMANADKELKEVANLETLSNEQDGVALVLERLYQEINKG